MSRLLSAAFFLIAGIPVLAQNFDPPPAMYSSSRSRTTSAGPKAVHLASEASSIRPRGMKGAAIARAAAGAGSMQQ